METGAIKVSLRRNSAPIKRSISQAPSASSGLFRNAKIVFSSVVFLRDTASPIMRTAVQACMSMSVIWRLNSAVNRLCIWVAPHRLFDGSQLVGTSPAEPATGRASQVR